MDVEAKNSRSKSRVLKIVLVISLGLNVLVVGLVAGAFFRGAPPDHVRANRDVSALGLRAYYRTLDEASRAGLQDGIRVNRDQIKFGRGVFRAHLKALADALVAEPFDVAAVKAELNSQAGSVSGNIKVGHDLLMKQIEQMSPEARNAMAAELLRPPRRLERK